MSIELLTIFFLLDEVGKYLYFMIYIFNLYLSLEYCNIMEKKRKYKILARKIERKTTSISNNTVFFPVIVVAYVS